MSTYKEDFEKERSDRERLSSEKNAMKLKHDNEMSILHIKLDKLQKELNYYTSTNVKLEQQLRLRSSKDSDSYHTYLSTKVCVCMYVRVCVRVYMYVYVCVCVRVYMYVYLCKLCMCLT